MHRISRRNFLQQSSFAATAMVFPSIELQAFAKKYIPKLSFSTLGCPTWPLGKIVKFAVANNYSGVEIRVLQGELDLTKCPAFSATNINETKKIFAENNLLITDLGSSAALHHADTAKRKNNLDEAKRYIDLAAELESPYIRVFPNNLPADGDTKATLDLIVSGLNELGEYAKGSNVSVLMETHGDVIKVADLLYIMQKKEQHNTGLIWDFFNMWSVTKEPPSMVFNKLKKYIRHIHVKDGMVKNGEEQYTLLGKGEAPVKEVFQLLQRSNFDGFYSFEWEKMWHLEIEEPEIALAHYSKEIKKIFKKLYAS